MLPARRHEISRLEAFSDAVFGFALALLAVSADPPTSYAQLMDRMYGAASFACCFALLVWIWYEHNMYFRRYGLQDGVTTTLNGALLFVVLFYVYPLKFMFDSFFARFLPSSSSNPIVGMAFWQLGNASAVYGAGFMLLFLLFAALYAHAYARRGEIGLSTVEVFDARAFIAHHLASAAVGGLALLVALAAPLEMVFVSPMCFTLMGPAHWLIGREAARRRTGLTAVGAEMTGS